MAKTKRKWRIKLIVNQIAGQELQTTHCCCVCVCWGGERRQPDDDVDDNPSAAAVQLATPWSTHSRAAMAGDMSIGCAALKRSTKLKSCTSGADTDSMHHMPNDRKENGNNTGLMMKPPCAPQNMRGGLRVYKIVILGDGGVGKSGKLATAAAAVPSVFLLSVFLSFSVLFFALSLRILIVSAKNQ